MIPVYTRIYSYALVSTLTEYDPSRVYTFTYSYLPGTIKPVKPRRTSTLSQGHAFNGQQMYHARIFWVPHVSLVLP